MKEIIDIADLDCFLLTYNEPNKEEHWTKLLNMVPWAKRIDNVKGSDTAHKAVANASNTERFILIDGDNIPDRQFFNQQLTIDDSNRDCVFRWKSRNNINGLIYGNGGISCWPVQFVLDMKSHENSDPNDTASLVEFCFDKKYKAMYNCYSTTYPNGSAKQAFRAGIREGVKMLLNYGERPSFEHKFDRNAHKRNLRNLYIWQSVGQDVEHGIWAIYGALQGSRYLLESPTWDYSKIRDFEYLDDLYMQECTGKYSIEDKCKISREYLKKHYDFPITDLNPDASKFFKLNVAIHNNIDIMMEDIDVIRRLEGW